MGLCEIHQTMIKAPTSVFLILIFIFCGLSDHAVRGQTSVRISGDSTKFIGELNSVFFNLSDNEKKIIAPIMVAFVQKWNSEQYLPSQKKTIYFLCNEMLKKRIRAYPDFFNYINALNIFIERHQPVEYFEPWSEALKKLISEKNSRAYIHFLESTIGLFGEQLIYKSPSTQWRVSSNHFRMGYDSVPFVEFNTTDLVCYANDDSLNIHDTKGRYHPLSTLWLGEGGKADWRRAGLDPAMIYTEFRKYGIQMRYSKFTADSVDFYHKKYFSSPLLGFYTDKVLADVTEEKASYPRFASYDKLIGIQDLFPGIDYLGGFAIEGSRVIGSGDRIRDAHLFIKNKDRLFVTAQSKTFVIRPDRINASRASATIYYENDSIYHPGLQLKYVDKEKELSFTKDERVATISPWFDSYHKVEIYCEALNWKIGDPRINFEMMKGPSKNSKAVFESSNYYSLQRYEKLQGIDEVNPLNLIKRFSEQKKSRVFSLNELTEYMKKPRAQVEAQLLSLANRGFLVYDEDDKTASIKDKLFNYVNAKIGKADYDVIFFNSDVTGTSNAILSLDSFDLRIQGVPSVTISDSQQVHIYPKDQVIILCKDKDFKFSGKIEAGLFDIYTRECSFQYDQFKIDLPQVDSLIFYVKSRSRDPKTGTYPLVKVRTAITGLSGDLLIDDPKNKSGLKSPPEYPVFNNRNNAYVFWDKGYIQKGVYKREKFFFEVYPFTINSLDIVDTDSLRFTGFLSSAGIFPKIEEPLKVRPDYSLGLEKTTDATGLPAYGDKGTFISRIDLSDRGLRGDGMLKYLHSTTLSHDFLFLPDSMKTIALSFDIEEVMTDVEFPRVHGDTVRQFWLPYRDSLIISSVKREMVMYNAQSTFGGDLSMTPRELTGDGTVKIRDAEMDSKQFRFKSRTFDALIANFRIRAYNLEDLTISTRNYQTHFDFDKRRGEFRSNIGISKMEFPFNKYICSMDRFDWLIDNEEIQLTNEQRKESISDSLNLRQLIDVGYTGSEFISVHPLQDSLRFFAAKARYNLRTNVINADEVRIIKVADAAIYPDSGKVSIFKDARMQTLERAIVIANVQSRYHQFYHADISIASRKKYTGRGDYDYLEHTGERNKVHFHKIFVDTSGQTTAYGNVPDTTHFMLSPQFAFTGDVVLAARNKNLSFDGGFRPVTDCIKTNAWVKFNGTLDPLHVQIPLTSPLKSYQGDKLDLAMVFSSTSGQIYPAFFRPRNSFSDSVMAVGNGFVEYYPTTTEFRIATAEKLANPQESGNYFALNNTNCMLRTEGGINLGIKTGAVKMETYGMMDYFIIPDSTRIHICMALNFPFSENALQKFSSHLESVNLSGFTLSRTPYSTAMEYLLDKKQSDQLRSELELVGRYKKFPEPMVRTLFLADVWLHFDTLTKSYVSYGLIGIGSINKTQVNRYVKGIIELSKKRNGDDLSFYFELSRDDWYYFNLRENILQTISSNLEYNDLITDAQKSKTEQNRVNKEAKGFRYIISTDRKKRDFLRKFEKPE